MIGQSKTDNNLSKSDETEHNINANVKNVSKCHRGTINTNVKYVSNVTELSKTLMYGAELSKILK